MQDQRRRSATSYCIGSCCSAPCGHARVNGVAKNRLPMNLLKIHGRQTKLPCERTLAEPHIPVSRAEQTTQNSPWPYTKSVRAVNRLTTGGGERRIGKLPAAEAITRQWQSKRSADLYEHVCVVCCCLVLVICSFCVRAVDLLEGGREKC
jgi:hypothetical protein